MKLRYNLVAPCTIALAAWLLPGVSTISLSASRRASTNRWNPFKAIADAVRSTWTPVDEMRGDLCWDRKDMLNHEKCMEWMVAKCKQDDADPSKCNKLRKYVKDHCDKGSELACDYAKQLGFPITTTTAAPPAPAPAAAPATTGSPPAPAAPPASSPASPPPAPAPVTEAPAAPAPAPATPAPTTEAPAPAPATKAPVETSPPSTQPPVSEAPAPASVTTETSAPPAIAETSRETTKLPPKLQSQGFEGKKVRHVDGKTYASDWGDEYAHPTVKTTPAPSHAFFSQLSALTYIFLIATLGCA